jgi:hypothetical protein
VLVGVSGTETSDAAARVGVKVGNGVRVGRGLASCVDPEPNGSSEQARVIKTKNVPKIVVARDGWGNNKVVHLMISGPKLLSSLSRSKLRAKLGMFKVT